MKQAQNLRNNLVIIAVGFLLTACATPAPDFVKDKYYKFDAKIEINKKKGIGTLVVPQANKYKIEVKAKGDIALLTVRNCHRSREIEKAYEGNGVFHGKKYVEMELIPNNPIEKEACPLDIGAWDKDGRHSFVWVDFYDSSYKLNAKINCNGYHMQEEGVSICQAYAGTYQEINLPSDVVVSFEGVKSWDSAEAMPDCDVGMQDEQNYFRFKIPKGICVYTFGGISDKKLHRMTTIGYEHIILRE